MTRRVKLRSQKQRHTHKQRGGAAWSTFGDRYEDWVEEIEKDEELRKLVSTLSLANRNEESDNNSKKNILKSYINCLAHQDKLFRTALKIIYKKLGISNVNDTKEIIAKAGTLDTSKETMIEYIKDVEKLVTFERKGRFHNKISQMEAEGLTSIATILLFPMRLENMFIRGMSEIIVNIMKDSTIITDANNPSIKLILAVQYHSYVQSLAYTLTTYPLRDGYHLIQNVGNVESEISIKREAGACSTAPTRRSARVAGAAAAFSSEENEEDAACTPIKGKVLETFWYKFVDRVSQLITTTTEDDLFKNTSAIGDDCKYRITDYTWEELTAHMLVYAKLKGKDMNILSKLLSVCTQPTKLDSERSQTPDAVYDNVSIGDTDITFSQLMSNIDRNQLEYLLHLEVGIKEALARRENEEAATTLPSP